MYICTHMIVYIEEKGCLKPSLIFHALYATYTRKVESLIPMKALKYLTLGSETSMVL